MPLLLTLLLTGVFWLFFSQEYWHMIVSHPASKKKKNYRDNLIESSAVILSLIESFAKRRKEKNEIIRKVKSWLNK